MKVTEKPGPWTRVVVHLPFALVLVATVTGIVLVALQHWRRGTAVLGGALLLAAALRMVLPTERAGLIALRSRGVDVLLYGALGLAILTVALTIVGGPPLESLLTGRAP